MDDFHPGKVFSSIDRNGRYAWNRQAEIAHWNMVRLAETLLPLLGGVEEDQVANAQTELENFTHVFEVEFNKVMTTKLGLVGNTARNSGFLAKTFEAMTVGEVDFTQFFRNLTLVARGEDEVKVTSLFKSPKQGAIWLESWKTEAGSKEGLSDECISAMCKANPIIIPRNHRVEEAIADANNGNFETFEMLMKAVTNPFEERSQFAQFEDPPNLEEIVHETFCGT